MDRRLRGAASGRCRCRRLEPAVGPGLTPAGGLGPVRRRSMRPGARHPAEGPVPPARASECGGTGHGKAESAGDPQNGQPQECRSDPFSPSPSRRVRTWTDYPILFPLMLPFTPRLGRRFRAPRRRGGRRRGRLGPCGKKGVGFRRLFFREARIFRNVRVQPAEQYRHKWTKWTKRPAAMGCGSARRPTRRGRRIPAAPQASRRGAGDGSRRHLRRADPAGHPRRDPRGLSD